MPPLALRSTWRCLVVAEFVKSKQLNPSTPAACLYSKQGFCQQLAASQQPSLVAA
jgi:hypothetical protein